MSEGVLITIIDEKLPTFYLLQRISIAVKKNDVEKVRQYEKIDYIFEFKSNS